MEHKKILEKIDEIKAEKREACIYGAGVIGKNSGLGLLMERNVKPNFFCDRNSTLWGKEIVNGIRCISIEEMKKRNPICFIMLSKLYEMEALKFLQEIGITDIILYDELCDMKIETYYPFKKRKQIVVYTCILGDYDYLKEPLCDSLECDYFLISDRAPINQSVYKYINISELGVEKIRDNTRRNRYCKMMPHIIFPEYKYSLYIDGSMQLKTERFSEKIANLPKTRIMVYADNFLDCLYMEAMRAAESQRDKKEIFISQMEKYWLEGMPEHFGAALCPVLLREHNNPICIKLMNEWWHEVENYSRKDQVSFPYVIWKNQFTMSDVATLLEGKENIWDNRYLIWDKAHKTPRI